MKLTTKHYLLLLLLAICISTGCHKKRDVGKASVVYGRVYIYGTNEPLANHAIYLYGRYGYTGTDFDYVMAETTTDANGNYRFEYEVVDGVLPAQTWLPSSDTESFNETQAWTNPNFQQYNSCYMQGPPPNSNSYTLGYHTTVHHDVVLYPYAQVNLTMANINCFDENDRLDVWLDSPLQQSGYGGIDYPFTGLNGMCDTAHQSFTAFNPTYIKWTVKRNGITTGPFYDTLTFNMCDEVNYEIDY